MLTPNQTVYIIGKSGCVKQVNYVKPAFCVRYANGSMTAVYRVYETSEEARKAISENEGKPIKKVEAVAGVHNTLEDEVKLLKLKLAVLSMPWYQKLFNRFFKRGC